MILDWLERRIDPFAPFDETRMPPKSVTGFAWFYLRPVRWALAALFVIAVIAGTVEASLYLVMRWFIDMLGAADSEYFQAWNLSKRSVTLDIKQPEERQEFEALVRGADAVVNNLRGNLPSRLGIDYAALKAVNARETPVVFVLWGGYAGKKKALIDANRHEIIQSAHPSPLSAANGFFGSKPFSKINAALKDFGHAPIDWKLPDKV